MRRLSIVMLFLVLPLRADEDGIKVYKKAVPSVVWIHAKHANGSVTGSGTIIDAERKLALTNYHVVEDAAKVTLYFPAIRDGEPIAEKQYYNDRAHSLAISARVIARDKKADLAIVQLESLPAGKLAVPLAAASAEPGEAVHSIGNAGKSGALWGYVPGKVRQVYHKEWKAELDDGKTHTFKAKIVETDSATNHGDSGGPLLNDKGELVGVTEGGALNASLLSTFVDVSEVKKLLASDDVKAVKGSKIAAPVKPREKATVVVDGGKFFTEETVKKAQGIVEELHAKKQFDVLVETFDKVPADDVEKVKKLKGKDLTDYMHEWIKKRMADENVKGIGILICQNPKQFYVEFTFEATKQFPATLPKAVTDGILDGLKNKKADDAIIGVLEKIRDNYGKK